MAQDIQKRIDQKKREYEQVERAAALKVMATTRTLDPELQANYTRAETFLPELSEQEGAAVVKMQSSLAGKPESGYAQEIKMVKRA